MLLNPLMGTKSHKSHKQCKFIKEKSGWNYFKN